MGCFFSLCGWVSDLSDRSDLYARRPIGRRDDATGLLGKKLGGRAAARGRRGPTRAERRGGGAAEGLASVMEVFWAAREGREGRREGWGYGGMEVGAEATC